MLKVRRRLMSSCLKHATGINNLPLSCRRPDRLLGVPVKAGLSQKFRSSFEPTMLLWRFSRATWFSPPSMRDFVTTNHC